ncbi:F-box/kelch-repeat protein [Prunus yedoensis var. nudiflora]|uniref:F-box/kelch-repeat protein n=1 Tax=Prunus yedoensis var. nudiflora TaxID=2094558 RepID=A0A314XKG8_PRUYE|nr:F-box/kelch-repeat protein [Prunus yedoensis var. nudiflora]
MARESRPRKLVKSRYAYINAELPTEIIFYHILPRLPPEALMRCKYVSKSWSSLIRSPSFVTDFNDTNKSNTNFLFQKNTRLFSSKIEEQQGENNILIPTPIAQLPLPTRSKFLKRYPDLVEYILNPAPVAELSYLSRCEAFEFPPNHVQSVHGLVCASSRCGPVFILNPSTQESIELPYIIENYRLASATYNFGFSPLTNEYKVLQILSFHPNSGSEIRFNVFTLGRDSSWRPLQVDPADLPFDARDHDYAYEIQNGRSTGCVCLNGAIHWIQETQKVIVVFDVKEETFRVLPLPEEHAQEFHPDNHGRNRVAGRASVVEVEGCVGVFVDKSLTQNKIVLWILKDYQNLVWVKETITAVMPIGEGYVKALGTIHTGELALALHFYGNSPGFDDGPPKLLLYDMESKQYRILDFIFPNNMGVARGIPIKLIASYDDSIVPLK